MDNRERPGKVMYQFEKELKENHEGRCGEHLPTGKWVCIYEAKYKCIGSVLDDTIGGHMPYMKCQVLGLNEKLDVPLKELELASWGRV